MCSKFPRFGGPPPFQFASTLKNRSLRRHFTFIFHLIPRPDLYPPNTYRALKNPCPHPYLRSPTLRSNEQKFHGRNFHVYRHVSWVHACLIGTDTRNFHGRVSNERSKMSLQNAGRHAFFCFRGHDEAPSEFNFQLPSLFRKLEVELPTPKCPHREAER